MVDAWPKPDNSRIVTEDRPWLTDAERKAADQRQYQGQRGRQFNKFNINNIKSVMNARNGYASPNKFLVIITPPAWAQGEMSSLTSSVLPFVCELTSLPGLSFTFSEIRPLGIGPLQRRPDVPIYTELLMTFLQTGDGKVMEFFHQWMQNVVNVGTTNKASNATPYKGGYAFETYYMENYVTQIDIISYNQAADEIVKYTLNDAFPTTIGDVTMNWAITDDIIRIPISFSFTTWHATTFDDAMFDPRNVRHRGSSMSIMQFLGSVGTLMSTISNFKKPNSVQGAIQQINNVINVVQTAGGLLP